jgi:hypothetical protein
MHAGEYLDATIEARKILKIEMVAHTVGSIDGFLLATILNREESTAVSTMKREFHKNFSKYFSVNFIY